MTTPVPPNFNHTLVLFALSTALGGVSTPLPPPPPARSRQARGLKLAELIDYIMLYEIY